MEEHQQILESERRILARAAEIAQNFPDVPIGVCLAAAEWTEAMLYGTPGTPEPRGLIGAPPLARLRRWIG